MARNIKKYMKKQEIKFRRHGDVNFIAISEKEFNRIQGEIVKHNGSYVLARGEATGSTHVLTVERPETLIIKRADDGRIYFALSDKGTITHTSDHEVIATPQQVFYVQVAEREVNHFADSMIRKVID